MYKQGSHRPGKVLEFDLGPGKFLEFEKVPFVLELSLNFVKSPWKYELVLEKYKIRVLSDLWDAQKNFLKIAQNWVKITRYTSKSKVWLLFYSICAIVPLFITGIRIKENKPFHFDVFGWKKCIFALFYTKLGRNWVLEKGKSPGIVLEFCFPISVQTLYKLSTFFLKFKFRKFEIRKLLQSVLFCILGWLSR